MTRGDGVRKVLPITRSEKLADLVGSLTNMQVACARFHKSISNDNATAMQEAREQLSVAIMHWFEHCGFEATSVGRSVAADVSEASPQPEVPHSPDILTIPEVLEDFQSTWALLLSVRGGLKMPPSLERAKLLGLI